MSNYKIIDETAGEPLVSVAMLAYNHGAFIREALESVLVQKTDFPIQIVIAEDCSPDDTREIILDYQKRYPKIIKLLLQVENVGAWQNNIDLFGHLDGSYIAALEGDDYWTDSLKLQKQVDFLEKNTDYSLCFHNAIEHFEDQSIADRSFSKVEDRDYSGPEIYKKWTIATASVVFRKEVVLSAFYKSLLHNRKFIFGDIILFIACAQVGKLKGMTDTMVVYRRHNGGAVFSLSLERDLKQAYHDLEIANVFKGKYAAIAKKKYKNCVIKGYFSARMLSRETLKNAYFEFIKAELSIWDFMMHPLVIIKAIKRHKRYL